MVSEELIDAKNYADYSASNNARLSCQIGEVEWDSAHLEVKPTGCVTRHTSRM